MREASCYLSSGFAAVNTGRPTPFYLEGDETVMGYLADANLLRSDKSNPKLIIQVAKKAVELFSHNRLDSFVLTNLSTGQFKSELHYQFLVDTLNFVRTGKRDMSISVWQSLLTVPSGKMMKKPSEKTSYSMNPESYRGLTIQQWLSHDGGLADLVHSMAIIFGKY